MSASPCVCVCVCVLVWGPTNSNATAHGTAIVCVARPCMVGCMPPAQRAAAASPVTDSCDAALDAGRLEPGRIGGRCSGRGALAARLAARNGPHPCSPGALVRRDVRCVLVCWGGNVRGRVLLADGAAARAGWRQHTCRVRAFIAVASAALRPCIWSTPGGPVTVPSCCT